MATVAAVVFEHHEKQDGTYNVKIRIYHKSEKKYIETSHFVSKKQLDSKFRIKELMSAYNEKVNRVYAKEGKEKEFAAVLANDPFTTLQICSSGHSQIYLGSNNGIPVGFDNNGYGYVDDKNREVEIRRSAIVPITIPNYFLQENIIFVSLK